MRLAVIPLHKANRPFSQVDWGSLGGLDERVTVLLRYEFESPRLSREEATYEKFLWREPLVRVLGKALLDHIFQDRGEGVALR